MVAVLVKKIVIKKILTANFYITEKKNFVCEKKNYLTFDL
jgi:hypothetical protein